MNAWNYFRQKCLLSALLFIENLIVIVPLLIFLIVNIQNLDIYYSSLSYGYVILPERLIVGFEWILMSVFAFLTFHKFKFYIISKI